MASEHPDVREAVDAVYRTESRRVLATLIRLLGDFDLAEEAMQDAFTVALTAWHDRIPANPSAWLISTGRFKAIDHLRRNARLDAASPYIAQQLERVTQLPDDPLLIEDDQLRLIFTCCHPALSPEARTALTLREVCGLPTEAIAHAFLVPPSTLAQRIVRAKAKIRDAGIPYEIPAVEHLAERLGSVLAVIYLVFNEGYSPSAGPDVTSVKLADEAIRLGRLLTTLLPAAETQGLLALMLVHHARHAARTDAAGELILLEDQDRSQWNHGQIAEGSALIALALRAPDRGPYAVQAAIAALHAEAPRASETDWSEIVGLYDVLLRMQPTAIVALNRAVAIAMRDGPAAGLALIDAMLSAGELAEYHLAHAARGELYRRMNRIDDAREAYRQAIARAGQEPERRFLMSRLRALG